MLFVKFNYLKEEGVVYETSTRSIFGRKIWIYFVGIWILITTLVALDFKSLVHYWQEGLFQTMVMTCLYFLFALYIYSKAFLITCKHIYVVNHLWGRIILKRSMSLPEVELVILRTLLRWGQNRNKGQIIFKTKSLLPFPYLKKWSTPRLVIPMTDELPKVVFQRMLDKLFKSNQFALTHLSSKTYLPVRHGLDLGRVHLEHIFREDVSIGRKHAQLRVENDNLYLMDLGSLNKTFLNGVSLTPNIKNPVKSGDTIKIGNQEFLVENYLWHKQIKIVQIQKYSFDLLISFLKQSGLIFLFILFFFPFYIYLYISLEKGGSVSCNQGELGLKLLNKCYQRGSYLFQMGKWEESTAHLSPVCTSPRDDFPARAQACLHAALANKFLQHSKAEINYLQLACDLKLAPACARLSIHTGNSTMLENALDDLLDQCQEKKSPLACKELSNISSLLKVPEDSFNYLKGALEKNYDQWYWISIDPELSDLRENELFKKYFAKIDEDWAKREKKGSIPPDSPYYEFLKAKYFGPYHSTRLSSACPSPKEESCFSRLNKNFADYLNKGNAMMVINSQSLIRPVLDYDQKAILPWRKWENDLNQLETYVLLLGAMKKKSKIKLSNLVGNILYYVKIRPEWMDKIETLLEKTENERDMIKTLKPLPPQFASLSKKWDHLDKEVDLLEELPIKIPVKDIKKKMKKKWRSFWYDEGVGKNYY